MIKYFYAFKGIKYPLQEPPCDLFYIKIQKNKLILIADAIDNSDEICRHLASRTKFFDVALCGVPRMRPQLENKNTGQCSSRR